MTTLPEYFAIQATPDNMNNPLWKKYIEWGNEDSRCLRTLEGTELYYYYGIFYRETFFNFYKGLLCTIEITLEEWYEAVNSTPNEIDLLKAAKEKWEEELNKPVLERKHPHGYIVMWLQDLSCRISDIEAKEKMELEKKEGTFKTKWKS